MIVHQIVKREDVIGITVKNCIINETQNSFVGAK